MQDRNHVLWYVIGAAAAAGFVQLCTLLTRDTLPLARQVLGAVGVAVAVSAVVTALGIDRLHLTPVTAGGLGIVSGLIPAGVWISVASKALEAQLKERLKVELEEKEEKEGGAQDVAPGVPEGHDGPA